MRKKNLMKRTIGVSGLQRKLHAQEQFKQAGQILSNAQLDHMKKQLETFKSNLEEFAVTYKKEIQKDAKFRSHFQAMCAKIGVDPLASNKGFWAELLGFGDFYYELGIQIIDVCLKCREETGGLLELGELKRRLLLVRGKTAQEIQEEDIIRSIKNLKSLGNGFSVIQIGNKKLVQSLPRELNTDHISLISLAQSTGFITSDIIFKKLGWSKERTDDTLRVMMNEGTLWIDLQATPPEYWVSSFIK